MAERIRAVQSRWVGEGFRSTSPISPSLAQGAGLFETLRVSLGVPLFVPSHLSRLCDSATALGLDRPSRDALRRLAGEITRLARRAGLAEARCRLLWAPPAFELTVESADPSLGASAVQVLTAPWTRDGASPLHRHKTIAYFENRLALADAKSRGGFDALFFDGSGNVLEGSRTNVFALIAGRIVTPPLDLGILPGTGRARLIRLLGESGIRVLETRISRADFLRSDEVFLTNAVRGVVGVERFDGRRIGRRAPGDATRLAASIFESAAQSEAARVRRSILRRPDRSS
ncbi:MAG: aminotransferase class IV [Planctomycetes bacterium]|nr:aminotransferase class IV [Planctomycetota bacterium]MBI3847472.1 aminotransferase class IV [Planctomycetota bacterium]